MAQFQNNGSSATSIMCLFIGTNNTELKEFLGEGSEVLYNVLHGGSPPASPIPYPSVYHLTELPLLYILIEKGTPFYILLIITGPYG